MPDRKNIVGAPRIARTVENEQAVLDAFEDDDTKSISEVARLLDISDASVHRILKTNRRHPYHYTRVQYLQPRSDSSSRSERTCFTARDKISGK
jgi:transposase-like protein